MRQSVCRSTWSFAISIGATALLALAPGCASGFHDDDAGHGGGHDMGPHDAGPFDTGGDTGEKHDVGPDATIDTGPVCVDMDGDGFGMACSGGADCDDTNANVSPTGTEICNGVDDDCDHMTDEGLDTPVFCGTGACRTSVPQCANGTTGTCTPLPGGTEVCNGIDDNCDGQTDEGFGGMTCGIGACQVTVAACMGGSPPPCVPTSPNPETCNGVDDDCNTVVDDGLPMISCGMGQCRRSVPGCSAGVPGTCTPGMPTNESCNGLDDNCDGTIDDGFGAITCGMGACQRTVASCMNGVPMSCTPGTPVAETCNGRDDDCNGMVDDGFTQLSCGVGACLRTAPACVSGNPGTCTPGSPAGSETCGNGVDDNCNGSIDEGCVTCTPPANTSCSTAAPYTIGSTVMGNNTCSGNDVMSTACATGYGSAGFDTAYHFTSTGSATRYTVTMTGPVGYDTVLHAHSSTACNGSDEIACVDDSPAGTLNVSTVTIDSPPSGEVYLVTDSYQPSMGSTFTLTSSSAPINNDNCAGAIPIRANGVYTGATSASVNDYMPTCAFGGSSSAPDVVYTLTARTAGTITVNLCGASYDSVVMVGTACGGSNVACNDDDVTGTCTVNGVASYLSFSATAGTTYYITIDGYAANSGSYSMVISGY